MLVPMIHFTLILKDTVFVVWIWFVLNKTFLKIYKTYAIESRLVTLLLMKKTEYITKGFKVTELVRWKHQLFQPLFSEKKS